jgi:hypothetical protein
MSTPSMVRVMTQPWCGISLWIKFSTMNELIVSRDGWLSGPANIGA